MKCMRLMFVVILFAPSYLLAQQIVPFKLGTFENGAGRYLGLVLGGAMRS